MEDTDLTRKAIAELMKEMDEYKEKESLPSERKKNPLGRPNKRFLGRTINSILTHNKRQSDRNQQRCQRKLKKLDAKQSRRKFRDYQRDESRHNKSESSHEVSSASEDEGHTHKKTSYLKKKKKKRRKKKQKSPSSSSPSSSNGSVTDSNSISNSSVESKDKNRKKTKHKKSTEAEEYEQDYYHHYGNEAGMGYYVDPNMAYAAMAYSQMNHMLQQQQIVQQQMVKEELEERVEIPSDLSISHHSESSLNISLNTSSAEEDENGILTFNLSSDDEEKVYKKEPKIIKSNEIHIDSDDSDKDSVQSHISLESEASQKVILNEYNEISLLSSSSGSDSDDLEIVEVIAEDKSNTLENISYINEKLDETEAIKEVNGQFEVIDKESEGNICVIANKSTETNGTNVMENNITETDEINVVANKSTETDKTNEEIKDIDKSAKSCIIDTKANNETNVIANTSTETDEANEELKQIKESTKSCFVKTETANDISMIDLTDE